MTLTEFLLARIAEDEAAAKRAGSHNGGATFANDNYGCLLVQPGRVLAECEAKRRIAELHQQEWGSEEGDDFMGSGRCITDGEFHPCPTLREMGRPYADHPDYREEWRP